MEKDADVFSKTWQKSQSWFQYERGVCNLFKERAQEIGLANMESFLSIGPGAGTIEAVIIESCMPRLKNFIAVEPNSTLLAQLKENVSDLPNVQVCSHNLTMQDYQGPEKPVQFILICHSIYYAADDLENQISRALHWLTPDGVMAIVVHYEENENFLSDFRKAVTWAVLGIASIQIKKALENLKLDFEEHRFIAPTNVTSPTGEKEFFEIMLNDRCTEEQFKVMGEVVRKHWKREAGNMDMEQSVFIINRTGQ